MPLALIPSALAVDGHTADFDTRRAAVNSHRAGFDTERVAVDRQAAGFDTQAKAVHALRLLGG